MHERPSRATLTWLTTAVSATLLLAVIDPAAAADPAAGRSVFQSQCSICHAVQAGRNMTGPTLFGIVGRKTGTVPGYTYSEGNKNANATWDQATLDKYLTAPRAAMPGTKMTYGGLKDDTKRADLIAYLATLH
ncbi:c-type cytochrome [Limobrevibacterium gyesilva]|uniref:Cytochrome c family protein n=1 Tax=Limobrevibacterium gyesilva TaxID=2991712 RepID=A0AA41YLE4_9PROT|nr:cytochrome c family protein [Limobrevibacterium gyesilva]MCW3474566.1 cytochrome c family protein [Limobrevibacterium gyesilva]